MRLVVPARVISVAGDGMAMVVLLLRTHDAGHGPAAITGLLVAFAAPIIVLMGVAGHVADSRDSRQVLVVSTSAQILACVGLAVSHGLVATYVLVVVLQTGQAFSGPVWSALVPRIVGDEQIGAAVALQQGLGAATAPAGAALGGVLVGLSGASVAFWCDAGTFVALLLAAVLVRTRSGTSDGGPASISDVAAQAPRVGPQFLSGFRVLRRDDVLWPLFCALLPLIVVGEGVNVVEVFLVRDELHASPAQYGLSEAAFGVGAVAGSITVGRLVADRARVAANLWGLGVLGAMVVGQGLAPTHGFYLGCAAILGAGNSLANGALGALMMTRTPAADRGKVMSAMYGASRVCSVAALIIGGVLGTAFGPRPTFVLGGAAALLVIIGATAWFHCRPALPQGLAQHEGLSRRAVGATRSRGSKRGARSGRTGARWGASHRTRGSGSTPSDPGAAPNGR